MPNLVAMSRRRTPGARAAGVVLLGTAAAGFHDLAGPRPARLSGPARLSTKA